MPLRSAALEGDASEHSLGGHFVRYIDIEPAQLLTGNWSTEFG
jgi:hypothetical protein